MQFGMVEPSFRVNSQNSNIGECIFTYRRNTYKNLGAKLPWYTALIPNVKEETLIGSYFEKKKN